MENKKNYITFILLTFLSSFTVISQMQIENHHVYGGSGFDKTEKIIVTANGNRLIVGSTESTDGDFSNGTIGNDFDVFIMMLSAKNEILWTKTFGGSQYDSAIDAFETTTGDFMVLAETNSKNGDVNTSYGLTDTWLLKLNSNGSLAWQTTIGGNGYDNASKMLALPNGTIALFGSSTSTDLRNTTSLGDKDGWIAILDEEGALISHTLIGGSGIDMFTDALIIQNEIVFVGSTNSLDNTEILHSGGFDHWMVAVNFDGVINWQNSYGGTGNDFCKRITGDDANGFVTTGSFYNENEFLPSSDDISLNHFSNLGNPLWKRTFGGSGKDIGNAIIKSGDQYIIAATTNSQDGDVSDFFGGNDNWILILNINGILIEELNRGGENDDQFVDVILTDEENKFLALGYSESIYSESNGGFDVEVFEISLNTSNAGLETLKEVNVTVFPNPMMNSLSIDTKGKNVGDMQLIDNSGRIVVSATQSLNGSYEMNVSELKAGTYYLSAEKLTNSFPVVKI